MWLGLQRVMGGALEPDIQESRGGQVSGPPPGKARGGLPLPWPWSQEAWASLQTDPPPAGATALSSQQSFSTPHSVEPRLPGPPRPPEGPDSPPGRGPPPSCRSPAGGAGRAGPAAGRGPGVRSSCARPAAAGSGLEEGRSRWAAWEVLPASPSPHAETRVHAPRAWPVHTSHGGSSPSSPSFFPCNWATCDPRLTGRGGRDRVTATAQSRHLANVPESPSRRPPARALPPPSSQSTPPLADTAWVTQNSSPTS